MALEQANLDQLKETLSQLDSKLETADSAEHVDLLSLRQDLIELIALQEEQLLNNRKAALLDLVQCQLSTCPASTVSNHLLVAKPAQHSDITEQLKQALVGQKCSVVDWTANGRFVRHNAVICDVVDNSTDSLESEQELSSLREAGRVRVFLTHPTRTTDLPCTEFMTKGFCHRGIRCRWSHGKIVSCEDIGEWYEPEAHLYLREGQPCLVKERPHSSRFSIWRHAFILHTDVNSETCVVQWGHTYQPISSKSSDEHTANSSRRTSYDKLEATVANIPLNAVWPLTEEEQNEDDELAVEDSDSSSSASDDTHVSAEDTRPQRCDGNTGLNQIMRSYKDKQKHDGDVRSKVNFVSGGMLSPDDILRPMPYLDPVDITQIEKVNNAGQFGAWEAHTRGIGSQLLSQMGYSGQGGLGLDGTGRQLPVALLLEKFQILSDGWNKRPSLDRLLQCNKCSTRERRRSRHRTKCDLDTTTSEDDNSIKEPYLFRFLNSMLQHQKLNIQGPSTTSSPIKVQSTSTREAAHEIRVQLFRIQEDIARIEQQIHRTLQSIERNQGRDQVMVKQAEQRLSLLRSELKELRGREQTLQRSKTRQTEEKKLRVF